MKSAFKTLLTFSLLFFVSLFIVAFLVPSLYDFVESSTTTSLPYEGALRLFFLGVWFFMLVCAAHWIFRRGDRRHWFIFSILTAACIPLAIIFFLDSSHRLLEEYSWIRYSTAGSLVLASLNSLILAVLYIKEGPAKRSLVFLWLLFCAAFGFGAVDELYEVHEAIGRFLEGKTSFLGNATTDYVTLGYAVVALVVISFCFRIFMREYCGRSTLFFNTLFMGGVVYFASTFLDTFDVIFEKKLRSLAKLFSQDIHFVFLDPWYVLWAPHNFLNGLEEVFEFLAATLFFVAALILFFEKRFLEFAHHQSGMTIKKNRNIQVTGVVIAVCVIFSFLSAIRSASATPLVDERISIAQVANHTDSLRHTDDLFFHPSWGVVIANEGRGTVLQYKDDTVEVLPDPKKAVSDTDSVGASRDAIYAADGSHGMLFSYTTQDGWKKKFDKDNGLEKPEAFVVHDGVFYILDESKKTITKIPKDGPSVIWKPEHSLWKTPEGIDYDKKTDTLIVTDDTSGAVFRIQFKKSVTLIAKFKNPEDITVLADGRILLTDNGWGAVFLINPDDSIKKLIQFKRPYRDLQGIAVDEKNRIYVVTADGFDYVSFMPSFLFRIDDVL